MLWPSFNPTFDCFSFTGELYVICVTEVGLDDQVYDLLRKHVFTVKVTNYSLVFMSSNQSSGGLGGSGLRRDFNHKTHKSQKHKGAANKPSQCRIIDVTNPLQMN